MAVKIRSRKYLLTINNPVEHGLEHTEIKSHIQNLKNVKYYCMADEIGDEGTYHTHIFIWFSMQTAISTVKAEFNAAHIDVCNGQPEEVRDYVLKQGHDDKAHTKVEGTFEESEEWKDATSDSLTSAVKAIQQGADLLDVIADNEKLVKQFNVLKQYKAELDYQKYSKVMRDVEVIYKWGTSGTGKSSSTYAENEDWSDIYVVQDYLHPFDNYNGQSIIVFEEYRSNFMMTNMLQYLDRYPVALPARYNNRMAQFTKIYVISNLYLYEQYSQCDEASRQAFLRRFDRVEYYYDDHIDITERVYTKENGFQFELRETKENIYSTWYRNNSMATK